MCRWLLAVAISFSTLAVAPAADPAKLAEQLAHRDYHLREAAGKQLDALGAAALPALRHAIATGSPEALRRAQAILRRITARIENERLLAPKLVTLDFRVADFKTVADAIQKQTGYKLSIEGDGAKAKKLTIRMTKRPFWEAVGTLEKQLGVEVDRYRDADRGVLLSSPLGKTLRPTYDNHSVRVHVDRFPMDSDQLSTGIIPMILSLRAEPGLELVGSGEITVTKATTSGGVPLQHDTESGTRTWAVQRRNREWRRGSTSMLEMNGIAHTPDPDLGHYLPPKNAILFRTPPGKPITKLASFEGVVRAKVRVDEPVTFDLSDPKKAAGVTRPNSCRATFLISAWKKGVGCELAFSQSYLVEAAHSASDSDSDWIGHPRISLTNAAGERLRLDITGVSSTQPGLLSGSQESCLTTVFIIKETKPNQGPPTKLNWSAPALVEVEVPFKFTDLPVIPGTRDPKAVAKEPVLKPIARERIHGGIGP